MASVPSQVGYYVTGGIFVGAWLWFLFNPANAPTDDFQAGSWFVWGLVGVAIAGGIYGGRLAEGSLQAIIWVAAGIAIAFVVMAAITEETGNVIASVFAGAGALLIAGGVSSTMQYQRGPAPGAHRSTQPAPAQPPAPSPGPPPAGAPPAGPPPAQGPPGQQWQQAGSQQQGVTVVQRGQR